MTFINLWGLIALISLIALLLIYILKPNYQQNFVSSTFIWKLSLKYKRTRNPISKLKNIILIICQVLILLGLTFVLTKPIKVNESNFADESIFIIDASCSMRVGYDDESRFEKAIDEAMSKINGYMDEGKTVSVIVAGKNPYFLTQRVSPENKQMVLDSLDELKDNYQCEYGSSDLEDAIDYCSDMLLENPNTTIEIYTDQSVDYVDKGINVNRIVGGDEFNAAILNAYGTVLDDNRYYFTVEVVCYGRDEAVDLNLSVYGANKSEDDSFGNDYEYTCDLQFSDDQIIKVIFANDSSIDNNQIESDDSTVFCTIPDTELIYSYDTVHIGLDIDDSFYADNTFDVYGGNKETIKVLYASAMPNGFINGALFVMKSLFINKYNISITEYKGEVTDVPFEGYDLYIYEHTMMPRQNPIDGVVVYSNPERNVPKSGFSIGTNSDETNRVSFAFKDEESHPIMNKIVAENLNCTIYRKINNADADFVTLMSCKHNPVLMIRDTEEYKQIVMLFSMHYSNLPVTKELPILFYNIFDYFIPTIIDSNSFEVGDDVTVKTRGKELTITGSSYEKTINEFPSTISVDMPGTYKFSQNTFFGKELEENIFVRIPREESNIFPVTDILSLPIVPDKKEDVLQDLLLYIAIAITAIGFIEWILKVEDAA